MGPPKVIHTILLVGATGSGKTSILNGMLNYVFNFNWTDPFRFKLDQTANHINVYDIHHWKGFYVDSSLIIIDTPGYGEDPAKNQKITASIRRFFEDGDGDQELDMIGFVMKSTLQKPTATEEFIYESLVSIFGDEIKESIKYLLTFAEHMEAAEDPPLLKAILGAIFFADDETDRIFRFDNRAFVCRNFAI